MRRVNAVSNASEVRTTEEKVAEGFGGAGDQLQFAKCAEKGLVACMRGTRQTL